MKMEERDRLIKEEGKKMGKHEKLINQVLKKVQKGKSINDIADELEEAPDVILPIYNAIQEHGLECDIETIYQLILKNNE